MDESTARGFGAAAVLGAVLSVVASMPSRWFGAPQTDAYLFDPAAFSPLWIQRTLVPTLSVLAGVLVAVGIAGLVARDRHAVGRLRRFSGYTAVVGLAMLVPALVTYGLTRSGTDSLGTLAFVGGLLVGVVGLVLAVPALVAVGVGYARAGRRVLGAALAGGPLLAVLASVGASAAVSSLGVGALPTVVLFAVAPLAAGHELWTHPTPVGTGSNDGDAATSGPRESTRHVAGTDEVPRGEAADGEASTATEPAGEDASGRTGGAAGPTGRTEEDGTGRTDAGAGPTGRTEPEDATDRSGGEDDA